MKKLNRVGLIASAIFFVILIFVVIVSLSSCFDSKSSRCTDEHFRSFAVHTVSGALVAVFNLRQETENENFVCGTDIEEKSKLFLTIDNGLDLTLSFDYDVKLELNNVVETEFTGSLHRLKPGTSTRETMVSTDLLDLDNSLVVMQGTNVVTEDP